MLLNNSDHETSTVYDHDIPVPVSSNLTLNNFNLENTRYKLSFQFTCHKKFFVQPAQPVMKRALKWTIYVCFKPNTCVQWTIYVLTSVFMHLRSQVQDISRQPRSHEQIFCESVTIFLSQFLIAGVLCAW